MTSNDEISVTYLSYTGMDESLGKSQVIPYINLISKLADVHLVSFEKKELSNNVKSQIASNFISKKIR